MRRKYTAPLILALCHYDDGPAAILILNVLNEELFNDHAVTTLEYFHKIL